MHTGTMDRMTLMRPYSGLSAVVEWATRVLVYYVSTPQLHAILCKDIDQYSSTEKTVLSFIVIGNLQYQH